MLKICSGPIFRQYLVIIAANLSSACLGLHVAWSSPMLVKLKDGTGTGLPRPITDAEGSWIASIGVLCSLPVHFTIGLLMDKIGRRTCLLLACVPRLLSCLIFTFATEIWMVLLARAIDGLAVGTPIAVTATYSSEVASKDIRGALGTILQMASATGMLITFSVAPFLPYFYVNLMYLSIAIGVCLPLWMLPESPYFLYSKGRKEEAKKVLTFFRASEILVEEEIKQYKLSLNESVKTNRREIFTDFITLKTLGKVIFLSILLEVTGYNAVLFYTMPILQLSQTSVKEEIGSVLIGCIQLIANFCTVFLTDRLGRKPILIATLCGKAVGMIGLATFFYLKEEKQQEISGVLNYVPLVSMMLVIFSFNAGLGALYWTVIAELFDSYARAVGVSSGTFTATFFLFITTKYFVSIINVLGLALTFGIFSILCIIMAVLIIVFIPETKGKTFLEIQIELGRSVKLR